MKESTVHSPQSTVGASLGHDQQVIAELLQVSRDYHGTPALCGIDLRLERGRIYAVIGPNGSGKSTLIRMINLLERPSEGRIVFGGIDAWAASSAERLMLMRQMTLVAQKPAMFHMSVADNIGYGLRLLRRPEAEVRSVVKQMAELLEVSHLLTRNAVRLSGGEAQRVSTARALAIKPQLLLLDEPSANLDPGQTLVLERAIQTVCKEQHCTVLLVTHYLAQARRVADEVLLLWRGELVEKQQATTFFSSPQHAVSRAFLESERV